DILLLARPLDTHHMGSAATASLQNLFADCVSVRARNRRIVMRSWILLLARYRQPLHDSVSAEHAHLWPGVFPLAENQAGRVPSSCFAELLSWWWRTRILQSCASAPIETPNAQSAGYLAFLLRPDIDATLDRLGLHPSPQTILELIDARASLFAHDHVGVVHSHRVDHSSGTASLRGSTNRRLLCGHFDNDA